MELLARAPTTDFSQLNHSFKSRGNPINYSRLDDPNPKLVPMGYRRATSLISQHYKQESSANGRLYPLLRSVPLRFFFTV